MSSSPSAPVDHQTIFLIEGDHAVRDAVTNALEAAGFAVVAFAAAEEFLARPAAGAGCLLLDLDLPGMSGSDLLGRLERRRRRLPAVLMSSRLQPASQRTGPTVRILQKPFGEDELIAVIRATLQQAASGS